MVDTNRSASSGLVDPNAVSHTPRGYFLAGGRGISRRFHNSSNVVRRTSRVSGASGLPRTHSFAAADMIVVNAAITSAAWTCWCRLAKAANESWAGGGCRVPPKKPAAHRHRASICRHARSQRIVATTSSGVKVSSPCLANVSAASRRSAKDALDDASQRPSKSEPPVTWARSTPSSTSQRHHDGAGTRKAHEEGQPRTPRLRTRTMRARRTKPARSLALVNVVT